MTTYATLQDAVNDPSSNISKQLARSAQIRAENAKVIDAYMAKGMTREQAWAEALRRSR